MTMSSTGPDVATKLGSTAPVARLILARPRLATPLTVVKLPPMKSEVPSEAIAVTGPLVSATNGSSSPLVMLTAMKLARGAVCASPHRGGEVAADVHRVADDLDHVDVLRERAGSRLHDAPAVEGRRRVQLGLARNRRHGDGRRRGRGRGRGRRRGRRPRAGRGGRTTRRRHGRLRTRWRSRPSAAHMPRQRAPPRSPPPSSRTSAARLHLCLLLVRSLRDGSTGP